MSIKLGEAYWEVTTRYNKAADVATAAQIRKNLQAQSNDQDQILGASETKLFQQKIKNLEYVKGLNKQADEQERAHVQTQIANISKNISAQKSLQAQKDRSIASAERDAARLERQRKLNNDNEVRDVGLLARLKDKFNQQEQTNNESTFHKLATQFRTIGTLARGFGAGFAVTGAFSLIQDALGGIIAAGPIAAAALALIPPAVAAIGVEAIILKGAFKGVGSAISDGFDPSKAKQFNAELKKLAPSARTFVQEVVKAKGILPNIQQTFFSAPQMKLAGSNVKTFFEGIKGNFKSVILANGGLVGGIADAITGKQGTKNVDSFLGSLSILLKDITPSVTTLTGSLLGFITRVANQMAGPGGKTISHFFDGMARFLDRVNVPGLMDKASAAFRGFGGILSDIGGTIGGIIKAFGGTDNLGAGFFRNIGGLFDELNKFSNSKTGQAFLKELVGTLNSLSRIANGVLKDALGFLAGAFAGLYPAIRPFADSVKKLADAILTPQFGEALGHVAQTALSLATTLINFLTPAIKALVNFLVAHPKILDALAAGIGAIWLALKVGKGVKSVAGGINDITTALNFFKNPKKILAGMGEVAAGETAIGDAGATAGGKSKVGALTSSLGGKLGLYGVLIAVGGGLAYVAGGLADPHGFKDFHSRVFTLKDDILGLLTGKSSFGKLKQDIVEFGIALDDPGPLRTFFANIGRYVIGAINGVKTAFNSVKNFITRTVPGWFSTMASKIDSVFNGARNRVSQFINDDIIGTYKKVANFVTKTVPGWFNQQASNVNKTLNGARNRISQFVKTDITGAFNAVKNFIINTIPGWWGTFASKVNVIYNGARNRIKQFITTDVKAVFTSVKTFILTTVPGWFNTMKGNILGNISSLVSGIQDIWSKIVAVFSKPLDTVINVVIAGKNGLVAAWNAVDSKLGNKFQMNKPKFVAPGPPGHVAIPKNADGGYISDTYGGPRQDNVYLPPSINAVHPGIAVSGGEYVLNAKSVSSIPMDYLNALNKFGGKAVSGDPSAIHIFDPSKQKYKDGGLVGYAGGGSIPSAAANRVPGVLNWLHSIAGRVPYVLGGNGPNSFDCSSLVGNVWARLTGNPINRRYFVTGTEANWLLNHGFANGADPSGFTVGLTSPPEHTVGILAGHRFEAAHTGTRMRFDDGAANALGFSRKFHMVGLSGLAGSLGAVLPAAIQAVSTPAKFLAKFNGIINKTKLPQTGYTKEAALIAPETVQHMNAWSEPLIKKAIAAAQAAASAGFGAGAALGNVGNSQIAAWIAEASKFANIPASWVPGIETIIRRESGGNPRARNNTDANARRGTPSQGLMQVIPPTFAANHAPGTSWNLLDPVANIAAAVNYIHRRYGTIFNVQQADPNRPPKGYAFGGPVLKRDRGGPIPPGYNTVFNGTGKTEWVKDPQGKSCIHISVDGVDVTSKAHVEENNNKIALALNRKTGR